MLRRHYQTGAFVTSNGFLRFGHTPKMSHEISLHFPGVGPKLIELMTPQSGQPKMMIRLLISDFTPHVEPNSALCPKQ